MADAYRNDEAALRLQVDTLREELAAATADASEQARLRAALETALEQLKRARLSAAEQQQAAQRVGRRRIAVGASVGLVVLLGTSAATLYGLDSATSAMAFVEPHQQRSPAPQGSAAAWFEAARPHCNPVEALMWVKEHPLPADDIQSGGYAAACYALAHRIADARSTLEAVPTQHRGPAVEAVFRIVHPIADKGDDVAAGPVMELVLEFAPHNFQAVFHAGMAAYEKQDDERALRHLSRFLTMYTRDDVWRMRAKRALAVLDQVKRGEDVERPVIPTH